jgi:acetyl-CoA carboxylase biotin carboxyl carrier protein
MNEEKGHSCKKNKNGNESGSCFPDIPVERIKELGRILEETNLTEIEIEHHDRRIKVSRASQGSFISQVATSPAASSTTTQISLETPSPSKFHEIKSPMVGSFYSSPSPGADPFVKLGDKIKKGQTLCIIEAMKIMNELPSEVDGEVMEVCVTDSEAISFGQVLLKVKLS